MKPFNFSNKILLYIFCFLTYISYANALHCYVCNSTTDINCGEVLAADHAFKPVKCSYLQEPRYCVKMTGMYEVTGLLCYQCDSTEGFCPEKVHSSDRSHGAETGFRPKSCSHVHDVQYCVKTTGMFEGELGTNRFCSARDFGNECNMVQRPGDERKYWACFYTCSGDGCNGALKMPVSLTTILSSAVFAFICYFITGS